MILRRVIVAGLTVGALVVCGCNTWHGAGKDVEKTGENMQGK
jgi:predicted small secreted protein